jgi:AraC-like DNA-binding protein
MFTGLRSVAEDNRGYIWVGTRTPELVKIPLELITHEKESINEVQRYSPKMQLTDVFAYGDEVAFSNYSGLLSYVEETDSFVPCYLFGNEIAKIPKMFSSLEKDYQNNVWVGGNEVFLFHSDGTYTLEKLSFHQFEEVFSAFVFFHENEQRTWIGGNNGLFLLRKEPQMMYPEKVQAVISKVNISRDLLDLHINSIQWPGGNSGDETPDYPLRIDLTRNNSQVTFYFSLPYFNNENKTQFSYRLKNYSETWTNWSNEHFATYSNLPSGNYTFEVRALTINKQTSKEASIQIHVPTPWYVTNYAILFYLLFVAGLIYFIAAVISKQRIRKQLRIEDVIRKRMQENKITAIVQTVGKSTDTKPEDRSPEYVGKPIKPTDSKQRREVFLEKSLEIIENHIGDPDFGVESFCEKMNMNQAFLYRKILAVTGMSINSFIRNTRLKKAAQLLLETDLTISEVAYQTGFSTPSYFTRCFKNEFGKSPRDFVQSQHKTLKP